MFTHHTTSTVRPAGGLCAPCGLRGSLAAGLLVTTIVVATGCVPRVDYDAALADLQRARTDAAALGRKQQALEAELGAKLEALTAAMQERDRLLTDARGQQADLQRQVEETTMMNAELADRLRQAGQSVEALASERGTLTTALEEARARLEELKRQQAAAESRTAQFQKLLDSFRRMMDAGQLKVEIRDGRMLIALPNDVLFDSGKATLKAEGKRTLREVARVLVTVPDREFQVAGHTDNVKISTAKFSSNWALSTARAVEVVELLVERGMPPARLSAAGYGEHTPAASNDTPEGRAQNRRIEIALVPDLDEMVPVRSSGPSDTSAPDAKQPAAKTPKTAE